MSLAVPEDQTETRPRELSITVDGEQLAVTEGRTLLQALDDLGLLMNGVDVPHFCWHPKLSIDGSCRLCQVEIEGEPKLQIACNTPVVDGMVVRTQTERVESARRGVMELLLVNHPLDCPICDQAGECKLQDHAFDHGVGHARTKEPRRAAKKRQDLGPTIVLDQERCILCRRCVRFCREVPETGELGVFDRGDRSTLDVLPGSPLDNDYSMNVADICPVGALTTKDFRFKIRVWFLDDVPGICTGCSRGCNIDLGVSKGRVQRTTPRRNDAVNDTWMCDAGRLSYHEIGAPGRLTRPALRRDGELVAATPEEAVAEVVARIRQETRTGAAGAVALLGSAHATNEDLFVLRRFGDAIGAVARGAQVPLGGSDAILLRPEKAANGVGARAFGFGEPGSLLERIRGGAVRALIVLGHDVLDAALDGDPSLLEAVEHVILLDTMHSALERVAHVVLPASHAAEKLGTLTNFEGRVQRVEPSVPAPGDARAEAEWLLRVGAGLRLPGFDLGDYDPRALSRSMGAWAPAFEGLHVDSVGAHGLPLRELAPEVGGS